MTFSDLVYGPFSVALAETLGHFLWQGAIIGLIAVLCQRLILRHAASRVRYGAQLVLLGLTVGCPVVTFGILWEGGSAPVAPSSRMDSMDDMDSMDEMDGVGVAAPVDLVDDVDSVDIVDDGDGIEIGAIGDSGSGSLRKPEHSFLSGVIDSVDWGRMVPNILLAYYGCVGLLLLRLGAALAGGRRLRRVSEAVSEGPLFEALRVQAERLGVRTAPALAFCAKVAVPTVVGLVRPVVLLPVTINTNLTIAQIELLLAHELAHIRRYDHVVNVIQSFVEAVLFFHPAVWYVSRQLRIEREHCCDDAVVQLGGEAEDYARSLLAAADHAAGKGVHPLTVQAAGHPSRLRRRIARILGRQLPVRFGRPMVAGSVAVVGLFICTVAVWAGAAAKDENVAETPEIETTIAEDDAETAIEEAPEIELAQRTGEAETDATEPGGGEEIQFPRGALDTYQNSKDPWVRKVALQQIVEQLSPDERTPFLSYVLDRDESNDVRAAAARAIGELGDPRGVPQLVAALRKVTDEGLPLAMAAADALAKIDDPSVIRYLRIAMTDNDDLLRNGAMEALARIADSEAIDLLIEFGLTDERFQSTAVHHLAELASENDDVTQGLAEALYSDDETRVQGAVQALLVSPSEESRALGLRKLAEDSFVPSRQSLETIRQIEGKDAEFLEVLAGRLGDVEFEDRRLIAEELIRANYLPESREDQAYLHVAANNFSVAATFGSVAVEPLIEALQSRKDLDEKFDALGTIGDPRAIDALAGFVGDQYYDIARDAVQEIAKIGTPTAIPPLIRALKSPHLYARAHAAHALGELGAEDAVDPLIQSLKDLSRTVRTESARALGKLRVPNAVEPLARALKDSERDVVLAAVESLRQIGAKDALPALIEALNHDDDFVQSGAATALGEIGDPRAVEPLKALVSDRVLESGRLVGAIRPVEQAAFGALKALGADFIRTEADEAPGTETARLPAPRTMDSLLSTEFVMQLQDEDWWLRKVAVDQIGESGNPELINLLIGALKDEHNNVRIAAAQAMAKIGNPAAIKHLVATLKDEDQAVRNAVADALSAFDSPEVYRMLELAAMDNTVVSHGAVFALAKLPAEKAAPILVKALSNRFARYHPTKAVDPATAALAEMPRGTVVPLLLAELEAEDRERRRGAVDALAEVGGDEAREALLAIARNRSDTVRAAAIEELASFEGDEVRDLFLEVLSEDDFELRNVAAVALRDRNYLPKEPGELAQFYVALQDWDAARTLGDAAVEPLIHALNAAEWRQSGQPAFQSRMQRVRTSSGLHYREGGPIPVLGEIGDARAVAPLIDAFERANEGGRHDIIVALAEIGDPQGLATAVRGVRDVSSRVRQTAVRALPKYESPDVFDALVDALEDTAPAVRAEAVESLQRLGDPRAIEAVVPLLLDVNNDVFQRVAFALSQFGERAAPALEAFYPKIPDGRKAYVVEVTLAPIGAPVLDLILATLADGDLSAKYGAVKTLEKIDDPKSTAALERVAADEDEAHYVRMGAVQALGKRKSASSIPALIAALESDLASDEHVDLAHEAARALVEIGDPAALPALIEWAERNESGDMTRQRYYDTRRKVQRMKEEAGSPE